MPPRDGSRPQLQVLTWKGSDAELLDGVRAGEPHALARLYDRFAPDINRVVWKLLGADSDHDDLVHDVFLKVARQIEGVRDPERLASWVVAVAVNTVYKELRRRRVRRIVSFGADVAAERTRTATTARGLPQQAHEQAQEIDHEARDLLRRTYELLGRLGAKEQLAFTLRFIDDRSLPEIAALCGWSLSTVKRRVARARSRFEELATRDPAIAARLGLRRESAAAEPAGLPRTRRGGRS
jgi:RNA polymerase sigma-70 factor (ECF subfamily)